MTEKIERKIPSLQSRLVRLALQYRHFLRFQLKRDVIDWNTSIPDFRQQAEKVTKLIAKMPAQIKVSPITIDGLSAEWLLPSQATPDQFILYFHGGGYVSGSCQTHRAIVAKLVQGGKAGLLLFDYRLAPEHPFPAALEDSMAVYRWLLARSVSPAHIVFAGESAGGGLCLAALLALRDQGLPLPAAAVAISPWTDLKCTGESYRTANDPLPPEGSWTVFSSYYVKDHDPGLPWISPLYGDLYGLPPLLIYIGADEFCLDDSTRFAEKAKNSGVDVTLRVGQGMVHCFPLLSPLFPEAKEAMLEIRTFINTHLNQ
jgi:monoterpene epsilon-lactone hydrolase